MKKKLLLFIMLLCTFFVHQNAKSQTLAAGDIAFIGYNTSPLDGFSFITLKEIPAGTVIFFTERGWGSGTWVAGSTETHLQWIVPSLTPIGTVVSVMETAADVFTVTGTSGIGYATGFTTGFNLSAGDQILAYQSASGVLPILPNLPTFIAGIHGDYNSADYDATTTWNLSTTSGGPGSALPLGLTNGLNCISLFPAPGPEIANSKFNGTLTGSAADIMAIINTPGNWIHDVSVNYTITPVSYPTPAITAAVAPTVSTTAATNVKAVSATLGGNVTADGGDATIERGIVWATTANPTTANTKVQIGTGTGTFTGTVTGLPAATTIHFRAYATNSGGTNYGSDLTFNTGTALGTSSISQTNVSCNGGFNGTASVVATGGATPYMYSWSPSGGTGATATGLSAGSYTVTITDGESTQITRNFTITQPPVLNGIPSVTNVSCNGGSNGTATINASGGTPGYTYLWSNGATTASATGLLAGTYSVTITDANSCTRTISNIIVGQPAVALNGTPSVTNVSCNGGSNGTATIVPSGGTPGYTYLWSTGATTQTITGLVAGTYSVLITDANGCPRTITGIIVGQPAVALDGTVNVTNVSCNAGTNGTATVTASGGTPGYTYSWSPSGGTAATATGLAAGTYSVTITDANACTKTIAGIIIGQPAVALNGTPSVTNVSCNGGANGTATIVPSGGTPGYTYLWSNGATTATATGLLAGTYSVLITDANSCTRNITGIIVGQPTALNGAPSVANVSCNGGNNGAAGVLPSGGTPGYTYLWSNGATTQIITGISAGTYSVTITDANSCTRTISNIIVGQPAAAINGTPSVTNVSCNGGSNGTATIVPSGGTPGYTYLWSNGATTQTITGLVAGSYSVLITDANGCPRTITGIIVGQPAVALDGTVNVTNVSCNAGSNGTATVTASGGTPGYTYSWSPSGGTGATATGLAAGTYSVTITDANACSKTIAGIIVGQPAVALNGTPSVTNVSCNGGANGTATILATGGTPSYTYLWSNGATTASATGLLAGTYSVTITDANSCTKTITGITVGQPAVLNGTPSITNVSCNGGSNGTATITPSGGTAGYTYLWSNGATTQTITGLAAGTYSVTITDANSCTKLVNGITVGQPPVLAASQGTINNVSCNGGSNGSATVITTGGTFPYTYAWSPTGGTGATASGLAAGTYTVTVTDANTCQTTQSFTINEPAAFSLTTSQTDVLCNGAATGSATVNVTGGTGAYTYSWSPSGGTAATATGLTAGTYTVTISDANTCQTTTSFTIVQPNALTATPLAQTNIGCRGDATGSATVNVTGGTGAYTYAWSPSGGTAATASVLTAGTYTVTVKDANLCQTTQSFTITQPAAILSATTASVGVSCFGGSNGSAIVTVSGGTPGYTYLWAPLGGTTATVTGRPAGNYTVTITDANGCTLVKNVTILTPTLLSATTSKTDVSCNGGTNGTATVTVSGGTPGYTYSWSPSGGTAATATGLAAGTYTVTVSDGNTCQTTATVTIGEPAVLAATTSKTDVLCNGQANGTASVSVSGGNGGYTYLWSPSGGTANTATGLSVGNYSVLITDAVGCSLTKNFTINQPATLTATTAQVNATCIVGGQAAVTPSGGTTPYTYLWSNGETTQVVTGLLAGNYTATITDANGCSIVKNFVITTINTLVATTSQTDVLCNGSNTGAATVVPAGAPGPFTYSWSPSGGNADTATGLTAGNYAVTITSSNGCSIVKNFTITEPTAIVVTPSQTNVSCNGGSNGSASVAVTGGTGAYTYSWSPSGGTAATASGLAAGTYTVTIKDANLCATTQSFTITEPTPLAVTPSQTNVSCNGGSNGSATVNVTGGTGAYTYVWSPAGGTAATASGLAAGTYTVTISDVNLCQTTQSFTITELAVLAATTSQVNVSCNGQSDASATVNVTGGTGSYTYAWSPSGGTAATATGLAAGTYSVLITDDNSCTLTKTVTITVIPDVTAPVPNVTNLPAITNYCAVLPAEIAIPTATDNCSGIITATTTDPLTYTTVGNYVITWSYVDASGNTATQQQNISVTASPLNQVTFANSDFTYNGTVRTINVANLPAGASVVYATTPSTGTVNGATNAGLYTVTATVSPAASSPNCSPITLTAQLEIKKAAQLITFAALPPKTLGVNNNFNLDAFSNSGLPIRYTFTYTSALPPASVTSGGLVSMIRSGQLVITAHQDGDANYLPAADVSQILVIKNNDVSVTSITIGGQVYNNPAKNITYVMPCGQTNVNIAILNNTNATITPSANFTIAPPKPGIYTQNVTVTSEDGTTTTNYTINIEKPFGFYDIVKQKFNNVLLVNNNPQTNGGYEFVAYQWFKNGQLIGTGQYYTAGNDTNNILDPTAVYSVKMTTKDGKVLQTCDSAITLQNSLTAKLYPNPVQVGKVLTVEADFPAEDLQNMQISLYSVSGQLVKTVRSSSVLTEIQLPETTEGSMYLVVLESGNIKKSFKVIVK